MYTKMDKKDFYVASSLNSSHYEKENKLRMRIGRLMFCPVVCHKLDLSEASLPDAVRNVANSV
jgi:hypothetical protein